jgi:glucuronate isomerase
MKTFINEDFLLSTPTARELFHQHAASLPIIDYHCHLIPKMIADDYRFSSITELWLGGDHYKWRAMRANGVNEKFITGDASPYEKFEKWAETVPYLFRNPLYHWTHLELKTAFGIDKVLNPDTAREIFDECNEKLAQPEFSARSFMRRYHVEVVCTTDDPADTLEWHEKIKGSGFEVKVLPAWRPDKAMNVTTAKDYGDYLDKLSAASGVDISSFDKLVEALQKRHDFFAAHGCSLSDHGILSFPDASYTKAEIDALFLRLRSGKEINDEEKEKYALALLRLLAEMDDASGWVQQYHYGALRNNNSRMMKQLGPDTGYDSIDDSKNAVAFSRFFDSLDREGRLTKTIVYNLNPGDNEMIASMIANFQDGSVPGKMQFGAAWWLDDHFDGMKNQLDVLSRQGLLSRFVGMLTDSRSFLSYPRHEYFRRILCEVIGADVEKGFIPESEMPRVQQMVEDISYYNAKRYFNF